VKWDYQLCVRERGEFAEKWLAQLFPLQCVCAKTVSAHPKDCVQEEEARGTAIQMAVECCSAVCLHSLQTFGQRLLGCLLAADE